MNLFRRLHPSLRLRAAPAPSFAAALASCCLLVAACGALERSDRAEVPAAAPERATSAAPGARAQASDGDTSARADSASAADAKHEPSTVPSSRDLVESVSVSEASPAGVELEGEAPGLLVKRLVITSKVADREPVPGGAPAVGSGPVVAFLELVNPSDQPRSVVVTFERATSTARVGHVRLDVPANSPRWRTWGLTHNIDAAGTWEAVISTADGTELARQSFDVTS